MKKFLLALVLIVPMLAFTGCGGDDDTMIESAPDKTVVEVNLDYAFFESGSMSRNSETVYQEFYDNYVITKQIAPKSYELSFKTENGLVAQTVTGPWGGSSVALKEGQYTVAGKSYHSNYMSENYGVRYVSDSLYLSFDEPVFIAKGMRKLVLKAHYDCYLLLFNGENIRSMQSSFGVEPKMAGNIYYLFVNADTYKWMNTTQKLSIIINKIDGTRVDLTIGEMGLENGKYYFFNDMTNSFDIDPMPNGN